MTTPLRQHTDAVGDLFEEAAGRRLATGAPLAQRLRPAGLDGFVGQEHVIGPGRALRLAIEADRVPSLVLYGPPGTGKTTLARIVAGVTGSEFVELSAVSATVGNVREVLAEARERLGATGRRTILFLDEIHRFNKGQQDALLPGVEDGLVTLIGATTENPYFSLNSALLSRMQVYELEALTPEELREILRRGAEELGVELEPGVDELIAGRAGGDGRSALGILELAAQTASPGAISSAHVEDAARKRPSPLRPGRRRPLRHDLRLDQVDARKRRSGVGVLPGRDAGGRRGRPLHRPSDGDPRLRGHRQRRPEGPARRRGGGPGGRARRPSRGASQPGAGRRLPGARAEVERVVPRARRRCCRRAGARPPEPTGLRFGRRPTPARRSSAAARATSIRTRIRRASRSTAFPTS